MISVVNNLLKEKKMKNLILLLSLISSPLFAHDFSCSDVNFEGEVFTLSVETQNENLEYLINGQDRGLIDEYYNPRSNYFKSWKKLEGYYPTIGDGVEGYSVEILVNKFLGTRELLENAQFGFVEYRASGADGFYTIRFRCDRL
jgi:hypothetical protein